ncbi:MAG: glycine oxidase ThiO [Acidobacteria bacterium]|nr:glycine oxidase ThiO [Acidobacteriota bacterium]
MTSSKHKDVIVIGGGLIGCSVALRLAQAGLRVTVLERGTPGAEASSAAAGMLSPQSEILESGPFFDLCMASRRMYPKFAREVENLSGLKVDYRRDGTLLVATSQQEWHELETAYRAQKRMGLSITQLSGKAVHALTAGLSSQIDYGLLVPGDHSIDNEKLSAAVALACARMGVEIRTETSAIRFILKNHRVDRVRATCESGRSGEIFAGHYVLAAGCWSATLAEPLGIKLSMTPCHGQMMEFESPRPLPLVVRAGHAYLVPRSDRRIVVGTTSEYIGFEKAVTGEGLRSMLDGAVRILPGFKSFKFLRAWSGLRPDTADHLPILGGGEISNLIFATGHFRNGILLAPVTAEIVSALIVKGSTVRAIEPYRPARFAD